mmetsp:Transcript_10158/g.20220  ORF Transcript_10158/g.20220 Transcript_10158/m.20220 type:complete len:207 (-) Transcript_10158:872-1492(-)
MQEAPEAREAVTAADATELKWLGEGGEKDAEGRLDPPPPWEAKDSALATMLCIVLTVSTAYFPFAVSPLSMTASAPSRTALVTSETSALVGLGADVIDSSICVATITGLPAKLHERTMRFCANATSWMGISTPRSPRATMMPSEAERMESKFSRPSTFSILLITRGGGQPGDISSTSSCRYALISLTPASSLTKLAATKSTSFSTP